MARKMSIKTSKKGYLKKDKPEGKAEQKKPMTDKARMVKKDKCPACGVMGLVYDGKIAKYKCENCGKEFRKDSAEIV